MTFLLISKMKGGGHYSITPLWPQITKIAGSHFAL